MQRHSDQERHEVPAHLLATIFVICAAAALTACGGLPTDFSDSDGRLPPSQRQHPAEHLRELPETLPHEVSLLDGRIVFGVPVDPGLDTVIVDSPRQARLTLVVRDEIIDVIARDARARVDASLVGEATAMMQPVADAVGAFRVDEPDTGCAAAVLFTPTGHVATDDGLLLATLFVEHHDRTVQTAQLVTRGLSVDDVDVAAALARDIAASVACRGDALDLGGGVQVVEDATGPALRLSFGPDIVASAVPSGDGTLYWFDRVVSLLDEPASLAVYVGDDALRAPSVPTGSVAPLSGAQLDGAWFRTASSGERPARDDLYATLADGTPVHATASAWDTTVLDGLRQIFDGAVDLRR